MDTSGKKKGNRPPKPPESGDFLSQMSHLASLAEQDLTADEARKKAKEEEEEKAQKQALARKLATGGKVTKSVEKPSSSWMLTPFPILCIVLLVSMGGFAVLPGFLKTKQSASARLQRAIEQQNLIQERAAEMGAEEKRSRTYTVLDAANDIGGGKKLAKSSVAELTRDVTTKEIVSAALGATKKKAPNIRWAPDAPLNGEKEIERKADPGSTVEVDSVKFGSADYGSLPTDPKTGKSPLPILQPNPLFNEQSYFMAWLEQLNRKNEPLALQCNPNI